MHNGFPKWKYHKSEQPKLVSCEKEELSLGDEWKDTPAAFIHEPVIETMNPEDPVNSEAPEPAKKKSRKVKAE